MKRNTAENRDCYETLETTSLEEEAPPLANPSSYAQTLRTLGHALENHRFVGLEIRVEFDTYVIKGSVAPRERTKLSLFHSLQVLFSRPGAPARQATDEIELRYSLSEIQNLHARERGERSEFPETPDPHSLSQLLRGIGCFLDKRINDKLVGVAVRDRWVTIMHRSRDGQLLKTRQDIEYFYNFWVKMYLHRSSRPSAPPPSEPTFFVAR